MVTLLLRCAADEKDLLVALLWELRTSGILEDDLPDGRLELRACFAETFPADDFAAFDPRWEPADTTNWVRVVMDTWDPIAVGERFFVAPDWRRDPTPPGRIRLEVRPGLALGTGYHPTTQMCLEAMERFLSPEASFLDLGTGSGILSHAAWLLGRRRIIACDIDIEAVGYAAENLQRAGVPVLLFAGSTAALAVRSHLLAANIAAEPLIELRPELEASLHPNGIAVLSGFPPERSADVCTAYVDAGFTLLRSDARDDWACLSLRRS